MSTAAGTFCAASLKAPASSPAWRPSRFRKRCRGIPAEKLDWLAPGSWAVRNFAIWIGHPEDHQAWELDYRAREALMARKGLVPAERWYVAYEELLVAEGSDWMWWFGNDFSSDSDAIFDSFVPPAHRKRLSPDRSACVRRVWRPRQEEFSRDGNWSWLRRRCRLEGCPIRRLRLSFNMITRRRGRWCATLCRRASTIRRLFRVPSVV